MLVDLDAPCGTVFRYRDFTECSNTWRAAAARGVPVNNVPRQGATYGALEQLCLEIIDPLARVWGRPVLTYGFAGPELTKLVRSRIAPELDQHAAHEQKPNGQPICPRLGAAVDLFVEKRGASEIARWIFENRDFDRLYLYGDDRPLHVSVGPDHSRSVVELRRGPSGHLVPRVLRW